MRNGPSGSERAQRLHRSCPTLRRSSHSARMASASMASAGRWPSRSRRTTRQAQVPLLRAAGWSDPELVEGSGLVGPFRVEGVLVSRQKRVFTPAYRAEAVALVLAGDRPIAVVARGLGIGESTLGNWVGAAKLNGTAVEAPLDVNERAEIKRLREELRVAKMERDFLKKAAAFFASQQPWGSRSSPRRRRRRLSLSCSCVGCWACRCPGSTPGGSVRPAPGSAPTPTCPG